MTKPEKLHFKTSSGIKNIVGKDLITDRFVAIFELVKNAYDAKASKVLVSFDIDNGDDDQKFEFTQSIVIRDNGVGMNRDDLINKWLYLAYSDKKEGKSNSDRVFVGSKGIGRFSCDSLGEHLEIRTKKVGDTVEHKLVVNWSDFENNLETRFENIEVTYSSTELKHEELNNSYTVLKINTLRHEWNDKSISKVTDSLRKLKNPFLIDDGFNIYCGQQLAFSYKSFDKIPSSALVQSNISEVLKDKSITIQTTIDTTIQVSLFDRGRHIYTLEKENDGILKNVPIFISLNYLTPSAKNIFTRRMGIAPVNYGNIFVYRNNFRVNPYGNVDYDLFGLNTRKTQGYNRNIATRELIGHIDIADSSNCFIEATSRDSGFIHNAYFEALESAYMNYAHKHLERYVQLISWGEIKETADVVTLDDVDANESVKFVKGLTSKVNGSFKLSHFDKSISFDDFNPKKQLEKIALKLPEKEQSQISDAIKKIDSLKQENIEKEAKLANKQLVISSLEQQNKIILSRRPESSYGEQLSHHLPLMADLLDNALINLGQLQLELNSKQKELFFSALRMIRRLEIELRSYKDLLLNTNIDLRAPQNIDWYEITKQFVKDKKQSSNNQPPKVLCDADGENSTTSWKLESDALEFLMMLENFYRNAREHGATYLQIIFRQRVIEISSDSTPILDENLTKIFELGFSTKPTGTGIGLNQAYIFLNRVGLQITALNTTKEVCFLVQKKES